MCFEGKSEGKGKKTHRKKKKKRSVKGNRDAEHAAGAEFAWRGEKKLKFYRLRPELGETEQQVGVTSNWFRAFPSSQSEAADEAKRYQTDTLFSSTSTSPTPKCQIHPERLIVRITV